MSDFDLVSGLIDGGIYVAGIVVGIVLYLVGRRRGEKTGGVVMRGLGIVLFLVFGLSAIPAIVRTVSDVWDTASPTTTTSASPTTTATRPSTTTTTTKPDPSTATTDGSSVYWIPEDSDARAWAEDAWAYADELARPAPRVDGLFTERGALQPTPGPKFKVRPAGTLSVKNYGKTMCELLVSGTEAQVEARMRSDLGIERWEAYGVAWFDSLVNGLCVRQ